MIETARLIVRPWRDADRAPFAALNADAEVMRYFPALQTRAESDATVDRQIAQQADRGFCFWALERKKDGLFLGFTGLSHVQQGTSVDDMPETGWRLRRDSWGHGYASEAARAAIDWAWANTDHGRIAAYTPTTNLPSQRVMMRVGMTPRPHLDFDHPRVPDDSPLKRHVVFVIDRPERA